MLPLEHWMASGLNAFLLLGMMHPELSDDQLQVYWLFPSKEVTGEAAFRFYPPNISNKLPERSAENLSIFKISVRTEKETPVLKLFSAHKKNAYFVSSVCSGSL